MRHAFSLVWVATLAAQPFHLEKEKALGALMAKEYRARVPPIQAPAITAYLADIGHRLAPAYYTFELVDDELFLNEPASFPGGLIFVPASLILAVESEDEFAAMLAHAIAHIAARHYGSSDNRNPVVIHLNGPAGFAIRPGPAVIPLSFLKIQRQSELDADRAAVSLLAAAKYDPQALARYIDRLHPPDPPPASAPYPAKSDRLAALQMAIAELPSTAYPPHPANPEIREAVTQLTARPAKKPPRLAR